MLPRFKLSTDTQVATRRTTVVHVAGPEGHDDRRGLRHLSGANHSSSSGYFAPASPPALAFEGELDLRGVSKVRAVAHTPLAVIAVVLMVLAIVAGSVLIAWTGSPQPSTPRYMQHVEAIEPYCPGDRPATR